VNVATEENCCDVCAEMVRVARTWLAPTDPWDQLSRNERGHVCWRCDAADAATDVGLCGACLAELEGRASAG
jgi:hypothetical protein